MMKIEQLDVNGTNAQGVMLVAPGGEGHPNMIVVTCRKGYLMCGYLNLDAAEKFGDAAVLVGGAGKNGGRTLRLSPAAGQENTGAAAARPAQ